MTTTAKKIELRDRDKQLIEKMQKVLQAALGGEVIQCRSWNGEDNWTQANCVAWNFIKYDYRIKPADPEPLKYYLASHESDIALGINDFGELAEIFFVMFGRQAVVEDQ